MILYPVFIYHRMKRLPACPPRCSGRRAGKAGITRMGFFASEKPGSFHVVDRFTQSGSK